MSLTPAQKQTVASWVEAGDNLSTIQKKLADEFKLSMTYRDVRFLVDDLNLDIKDAALVVRFKFTARPKNPSMIQRMAIRRMYETLPKLGIRFYLPPMVQMGMASALAQAAGPGSAVPAAATPAPATTATTAPPKAAE